MSSSGAGGAGWPPPATGIVDFAQVARAIATELEQNGVPVATGCGVADVVAGRGRIAVHHLRGATRARFAVFCAGTGSDRLAVAAGGLPPPPLLPLPGS